MSIEFKVADVELGQERLPTETTTQALERVCGDLMVVEGESALLVEVKPRIRPHSFVWAVASAFDKHLPLVITPDAIWLLIVQGVAQAINQEPEKWREVSVLHTGKKDLIVEADELIERPRDSEIWRRVLIDFAVKMRPHLAPPLLELDVRFSTSTTVTSAALEVAFLDATREFFALHVTTACGIPSIRLEGTPQDWRLIETRAKKLRDFGLEWWHDALKPILREFTRAAQGEANVTFWRSLFNQDNESGGPILTGWFVRFFPYLEDWLSRTGTIERNYCLSSPYDEDGIVMWSLPSGFSRAPFTWTVVDESLPMEWIGGFGGVTQEESGALRPVLAWGVRHAPEQSPHSV